MLRLRLQGNGVPTRRDVRLLTVVFRVELTHFFHFALTLWLVITSWKVGGISDSWWVTTFRKTGPISRTNQQLDGAHAMLPRWENGWRPIGFNLSRQRISHRLTLGLLPR
jgi:hypothetical protein